MWRASLARRRGLPQTLDDGSSLACQPAQCGQVVDQRGTDGGQAVPLGESSPLYLPQAV